MLEAANADLVFTISLKRSTQNRQLSTSCPADYPIFGSWLCENSVDAVGGVTFESAETLA
jgi:hypothetical protein